MVTVSRASYDVAMIPHSPCSYAFVRRIRASGSAADPTYGQQLGPFKHDRAEYQ